MDEVQPHDAPAARFGEHGAARDTGGFWRSLPGVLTAAGTFLAGLAGLAAVIVPNMSAKSGSTPERVASPPADAPAQIVSSSPAAAAGPVDKPLPETPAQAAGSPPAAPAPRADPLPAEPPPTASDRYVAAFASDGFVVLRSHPTTDGAEVTRVLVGGAVRCGAPRWVADGYRWRRCVDPDGRVGYMSDTFLRKA